jgi:adenylate cyclase
MIELRTLGGLDVRGADGSDARRLPTQTKRMALLIYLVLAEGGVSRRRDTVVAHLWPELDTAHARGALRQALHFLRRTLGPNVIVTHGEEMITVSPAALWCDVAAFREYHAAQRYDDALAVYEGEFLEGFFATDVAVEFEQWIADTREGLRRSAVECAWAACDGLRGAGDASAAVAMARRAAALAPDDEAGVARLIAVLDESGDRAGALAAYDAIEARLASAYDAAPSPETQALIRRVRQRTIASGREIMLGPVPAPLPPDHPSLPHDVPVPAPAPRTPSAAGSSSSNRKAVSVAAAALVALAAGITFVAIRPPESGARFSLAITPLEDVSADSAVAYLADGLTAQLIADMSRLVPVQVINQRTMMTFRRSGKSAADIAHQLDAGGVMSGSLWMRADTARLRTQLVFARDDRAICPQVFDGTRAELLRMERDAARATAACLRGVASPIRSTELPRLSPMNAGSIDAYVRGRYYWNERRVPSLHRSIALFTESLHGDPTFAMAYSAMGDAYVQLAYTNGLAPGDAFPKARAAAERAISLDSTLAEPHATLGFLHLYYDWDWPAAEREFRRALAIDPSDATAHEWYGLYLAAMGRFSEARAEEARAQRLDPLSLPIAGTAAWVDFYAGNFPAAKRKLQSALRVDSLFPLGHFYLGRVFQETHEIDSAMAHYRATGPLRTWVPTVAGNGYLAGRLGHEPEARTVLARLDSMSGSQYVSAYAMALVHTGLHQPDSALTWLERGYAERTNWMVWMNRDFRWAPIRADPRFAAITRRMRLPP